ncbi:MAG: hypothetical protein U9N52_01280 [Campylobacterota bacterium]|nr:hypothetical protein [Campylobacterota bacterium]
MHAALFEDWFSPLLRERNWDHQSHYSHPLHVRGVANNVHYKALVYQQLYDNREVMQKVLHVRIKK